MQSSVNTIMQTDFKILLPLRLKELRGSKTQSKTASELGVNQQTYARWELGDRQPKLNDLAAIALHFGVSTDWLLGVSTSAVADSIGQYATVPPSPAPVNEPCAGCQKRDAENDQLKNIIQNLATALAGKGNKNEC